MARYAVPAFPWILFVFSRVRKQFSAQFGFSYPISITCGLAYELRFDTDLGDEFDEFELEIRISTWTRHVRPLISISWLVFSNGTYIPTWLFLIYTIEI